MPGARALSGRLLGALRREMTIESRAWVAENVPVEVGVCPVNSVRSTPPM
jgi:hypothetical protein